MYKNMPSKTKIFISIIIPTRNSSSFLKMYLPSIANQSYKNAEVIISDNNSTDETKLIARKLNCIYINSKKPAPQVCVQRNVGAKKAKGEYLMFLDHDMELPEGFLTKIALQIKNNPNIDAWTIPEHIFANNSIMTDIRNFENECSKNTVVAAARLIKKDRFFSTKNLFDPRLSGGPADWDMDIQLREIDCKFRTINTYLNHHEEGLTLYRYITKKAQYVHGIELYKNKWKSRNKQIYISIVKKQFDPFYRGVLIFFEKNKWKLTVKKFHIYMMLVLITLFKGVLYYVVRSK